MSGARGEFRVILGGDHVGKSSLLRHVAATTRWRAVAHDRIAPPWGSFAIEMRAGLERALAEGDAWSRELALSMMQVGLVFVRDCVDRERGRGDVLVDSHHYKVLAKCALKGLDVPRITDAWRTFEPPSEIVLLRADPSVLWERSGRGATVTAFECHGNRPTRDGFVAFQRDLVDAMLREARGVPVTEIDANDTMDRIARRLVQHLGATEPGLEIAS